MSSTTLLDTCRWRRSPATLSSFHQGCPPRNMGRRYAADPPTVEEIIAVMHAAGDDADAIRLRGLIVVLWRAGLRISEALALSESDLDPGRGAISIRRGKGGKRREGGMGRWGRCGWDQLEPWLSLRPGGRLGRRRSSDGRPGPCRQRCRAGARGSGGTQAWSENRCTIRRSTRSDSPGRRDEHSTRCRAFGGGSRRGACASRRPPRSR